MEEQNIIINQVDPTTFEFQQYTEQDNILISSSRLDTSFTPSTDYIEYYAYDESQKLLYPISGSDERVAIVTDFSVINGDTILYPDRNLEDIGYDFGSFFSTYNFYRKLLSSDVDNNYYISEISSDRTEVRLKSNVIPSDLIITSSNAFIQNRELADYFVDFLLNFGYDQQVIANNIKLDTTTEIEPSILIKLYEPLPPQFDLKTTLWIVEEISVPQAYNVIFPEITFIPDDFQFIKGPNYSIQVTQQSGEAGQDFNYETLVGTDLTSSFNQLSNLLARKEVNISVDYSDYENFIYFSSAHTRLENFYYKVGLIQSSSNAIANLVIDSPTYSSSKAELNISINHIIRNFDGYEYFMYFNSGSIHSYPKMTSEPPYILYPTGSQEALTWIGNSDPDNPYYGGQSVSASEYDANNPNWLYNAIPEYLQSDANNAQYELFVDMVAQQYDNTWLYTKNLTTRFDADNRLDYGISRDLVADAIRDFGVKLYSNNFNTNDLYTAFLGITPSGSTFPIANITSSYPVPSGYDYVTTAISASNDIIPQDNVNKRLYKRIYHSLPYLLKTKGTIAGLRALITSYGVPDTILRINEYGSKDRKNIKDWDNNENQFNYALHLDGNSYISSSFVINPGFDHTVNDAPRTLQFRFKTSGIPTSSVFYNIWVGDDNNAFIVLEYTGSGMSSGSYSGSVPSENNAYGTLKFFPDGSSNTSTTASVSLPFFDGGWWSVMAVVDYVTTTSASLYAANRIGNQIGFSGSDSITHNWQYWAGTQISYFPSASALQVLGNYYQPLTGALQEVRYWDSPLEESQFYNYVMNPYSTEGNYTNATPEDLIFRADLGTELNTGSRTSIHPKVTGSWSPTASFQDGTSTFYLTGSFIENVEQLYLNQTPGGIKNQVTDKIQIVPNIMPEGSTLSPYRSIQQTAFPSGSDPSINYLEVAFSPTDQVNYDITSQIGFFTLGDYIGDPRQISESGYSYPRLDQLRDQYFEKYISSYDVVDFVRLIKFFDNSLFKMIEDFTPARTSLSSGVVIKQNLLERNRQRPAQVSSAVTMSTYFTGSPSDPYSTVVPLVQQDQVLSGLVKPFPRDYNTGSSDYPQYATIGGSSLYVFDGGTGGVFEPFNNLDNAPISTSAQEICIPQYFYTSSNQLFIAETTTGSTVFSTNVGNPTNTMSMNIYNTIGNSYLSLLNQLTSSISQSDIFVRLGTSDGNQITHQINFIDRLPAGTYGTGVFGTDVYGYTTTASFVMYLTVTDNNPPVVMADEDRLSPFCFITSGKPYSGKTATEVSESAFAEVYPGVIQDFNEYVYPTLGTGFPVGSSYTESTDSTYGQGLLTIPRIDQREFYNGEFPNNIPVGLKEICGAFFGQDDVPDYYFLINWFNNNNFPEQNFLSPSNLPLAGNIWLWADTIGNPKTGTLNGLNIVTNVTSPTNLSSNTTSQFTYSKAMGAGVNSGSIYLQSQLVGGNYTISQAYFDPASSPIGFEGDGFITVPSQSLIDLGFTTSTNLTLNLPNNILNPVPGNKVRYIKMSNVDVNGVTILPFIQDSKYIILNLTGASDYNGNLLQGFQTWYVANTSLQSDGIDSTEDATLLIIFEEPSSAAVTSFDTNFVDLTFSASGQFVYESTQSGIDPAVLINSGITASIPQGYFPPTDRSPAFPTESFFRGWGQSTYFQTNEDGSVSRVGSGSGFSSDRLGNFNTGSVEMDRDSNIPYAPSTIPWFMNAPASTLKVLNNSSLVGGHGLTDLQMYTGSITASAVPIGPYFNLITNVAPTPANITPVVNQAPVPPNLFVLWPQMTFIPNSPANAYPVEIVCSSPSLPWSIEVNYLDDFGWIFISTAPVGGQEILSGTGTTTVYIIFDSGIYTTGNFIPRDVNILVRNQLDTNNFSEYTATQNVRTGISGGGGGGGGGWILPEAL
jgi:hypothetical protein